MLSITAPNLRSRPGDSETLIDHFLHDNAQRLSQPLKRFSPEARGLLLKYHWPGNVRQLKNVIERACIMAADRIIQPSARGAMMTALHRVTLRCDARCAAASGSARAVAATTSLHALSVATTNDSA